MQNETKTNIQIKEDLYGPIAAFGSVSIPKIPFRIEGVFTLDTLKTIAELAEQFQSDLNKIFDEMPNDMARIVGKTEGGTAIDEVDNFRDWIAEDMSMDVYGGLACFITKIAFHAGLTVEEEVNSSRLKSTVPKQKPADERRTLEDLEEMELRGILSQTLTPWEGADALSTHMDSIINISIPTLSLLGPQLWDICKEYHRLGNMELRDIQEAVLVWLLPNEFKVNLFEQD